SYYMRKDYENARVNFYEIIDIDSPYNAPAIYYYSHIHYTEENYETALNGFRRISDDPMFSSITPYYIAQILYIQKKYGEVVDFAPALMDSVSESRLGEMAKIIGESYFQLERYKEAIPYLDIYRDNTKSYTLRDRYQLAFAYYKGGAYEEARDLFEKISYSSSDIAQSALYHLADCYLHLGDKNKARIAFAQASKMEYDPKIQEDALFNYAKVTYELSYNPFNEAVIAFNQYLKYYPASDRADEVYNYLVMAYLSTRNYSMALESLEKIKTKDARIEAAYQKVAFFRGLELYKNLRFTEAVDILERSLKYGQYDDEIRARTYYWLGEAAYRSNDYDAARVFYNQFLAEPLAYRQEEFPLCHYSLGYIGFNKADYVTAESWFNKYTRLERNAKARTLADTWNRLGDCRFIQKQYWQAIEFYDKSIAMNLTDVDYAMFQKGFTLGLLDRPERKVEVLQQLITQQPNSGFVDDALFETGRTYVVLNKPDQAKAMYERVISSYPNSSYVSKSLNQLGLIYYNTGDYNRALGYYQRVVKDYPSTPEADNALTSIKNIYVRNNNTDAYFAFVSSLGRDISRNEQDSLMYVAAENSYTRGDCEGTVASLDKYLEAFPEGKYLLNAHYYKADCSLKLNRNKEAMKSLEYIISQPHSMFTEPALVAASRINFREKYYNQAIENYQQLIEVAEVKSNLSEARIGLMRCYYNLGEFRNTIEAAKMVLTLDKLQEEVQREAWYDMAKSYNALNEPGQAYTCFRNIAVEVNSAEGAEAKYMVAELMFNDGRMDDAEKEIVDFIDRNTPHQYWMGKAFLLLSDIYIAKNDEFQAIHTLQSIIDYYTVPDDGIIREARQRRSALTKEAESDIAPEGAAGDNNDF
ncbi:MAG: tetratricopeptide repeat protein, partial [Bacteroidota bacterium]